MDGLNQSLDDMISNERSSRRTAYPKSVRQPRTNVDRSAPYSRETRQRLHTKPANGPYIKCQLSNSIAGILIGIAGNTINELMDISGAKIQVSSYDKNNFRTCTISGTEREMSLAIALVLDLLEQRAQHQGPDDSMIWHPRSARSNSKSSIEIDCKFTIPKNLSGAVIGFKGSVIEGIKERTGARVIISDKADRQYQDERLVHVFGYKNQCISCIKSIIPIIFETFGSKDNDYDNSESNNYSSTVNKAKRVGLDIGKDSTISTAITLAIPDNILGAIIGPQGTILNSIISLSGANITVSNRGEFVEGTTQRIVTITGNPSNAQMASMIITQKLQQFEDSIQHNS